MTFEPIEPPWQAIRESIPDGDAEPSFDLFDQRPASGKPVEIPRENGTILVLVLDSDCGPGEHRVRKTRCRKNAWHSGLDRHAPKHSYVRMKISATASSCQKSPLRISVTSALHALSAPCSPRPPHSPKPGSFWRARGSRSSPSSNTIIRQRSQTPPRSGPGPRSGMCGGGGRQRGDCFGFCAA